MARMLRRSCWAGVPHLASNLTLSWLQGLTTAVHLPQPDINCQETIKCCDGASKGPLRARCMTAVNLPGCRPCGWQQ